MELPQLQQLKRFSITYLGGINGSIPTEARTCIVHWTNICASGVTLGCRTWPHLTSAPRRYQETYRCHSTPSLAWCLSA